MIWEFHGGLQLRTHTSTVGDTGSIPGTEHIILIASLMPSHMVKKKEKKENHLTFINCPNVTRQHLAQTKCSAGGGSYYCYEYYSY